MDLGLGLVRVAGDEDEVLLEQRRDVGTRQDSLDQAAASASELAADLDEEMLLLALRALAGLAEVRVPVEGPAVVEVGVLLLGSGVCHRCRRLWGYRGGPIVPDGPSGPRP